MKSSSGQKAQRVQGAGSRDDQQLGPHAFAQTTRQINEVIIVERETTEGPISGTASAVDQDRTPHFSVAAAALADADRTFETIAGDDGEILLRVMADARWAPASTSAIRTLFVQPPLTGPTQSRFALVTTVPELSRALRALEQDEDARLEHVFDD
ncbi:MAG: hypothetical protein KUG77_19995 [Nannocystaceae bacterium]|nr:hypothetical protein [Nannocystaceae bacterium]